MIQELRREIGSGAKVLIITINIIFVIGEFNKCVQYIYEIMNEHSIDSKCIAQVHSELWQHLQLVHSYLMVRTHVKNNEHLVAARLLIRVAQNISKFPARKSHKFMY